MTHEFKIGDLVQYDPFAREGYVIGHAPNSFDPDSGRIHPVVAADAWCSTDAEPEQLRLLSAGHTGTAYRLREKYLKDPLWGLLPIDEDLARARETAANF